MNHALLLDHPTGALALMLDHAPMVGYALMLDGPSTGACAHATEPSALAHASAFAHATDPSARGHSFHMRLIPFHFRSR